MRENETPVLLLKPAEAAKALAIGERLLWTKTAAGSIPCVRIGKAVRYSPVALAAWIASVQSPQVTESN